MSFAEIVSTIVVISSHKLVLSVLLATLIAQLAKTVFWTFKMKKFKLEYFYKSYGGFPSGHTAYVTALTSGIFILEGGFTNLFFVTFAISLLWIVYVLDMKMFLDINTDFFNKLTDLIEKPDIEHVESIMGHTYGQVIGGFLVGIWAVGIIFF